MSRDIEWNVIWSEEMKAASMWKRRGGMDNFWDRMAKKFDESARGMDRISPIISKLNIDPEDTVLDIGAGPGTLALPLSRIAKHVTAVEPSTGMLSRLKSNARDIGVKNISYINKKWEDVIPFEDLDRHDVTIASYSLDIVNISDAVSKIVSLSNKSVYLFTFAGPRISDYRELWPRLYGEEYQPTPDYICLYNILYDMGILANVEISSFEHKQRFPSIVDAVEYWMDNLNEHSPEAENTIRSYLSSSLVEENGSLWSKHNIKEAMIYWSNESTTTQ